MGQKLVSRGNAHLIIYLDTELRYLRDTINILSSAKGGIGVMVRFILGLIGRNFVYCFVSYFAYYDGYESH